MKLLNHSFFIIDDECFVHTCYCAPATFKKRENVKISNSFHSFSHQAVLLTCKVHKCFSIILLKSLFVLKIMDWRYCEDICKPSSYLARHFSLSFKVIQGVWPLLVRSSRLYWQTTFGKFLHPLNIKIKIHNKQSLIWAWLYEEWITLSSG